VPLRECKIPTLTVSPPPAAVDAGLVSPAGEVVVVGSPPPQAFNSKLVPSVAEPYNKNLRRPNRLIMVRIKQPRRN
jgi:hypothetical protein